MLQGSPYQTLSVPAAAWQGVGLTDMALPGKGPYNAMATAQNGHVSSSIKRFYCIAPDAVPPSDLCSNRKIQSKVVTCTQLELLLMSRLSMFKGCNHEQSSYLAASSVCW